MNLPENIYLVRHGHQSDVKEGLSPLGRHQAVRAAEKLIVEGFNKESSLISSTAIRCVGTAEIIAKVLNLRTEIAYDQKLFEMEEYMHHLENPAEIISEIADKNRITAEKDSKLAVIFHGGVIMRMLPDLDVMDIAEGGCVHKFCTVNPPPLD